MTRLVYVDSDICINVANKEDDRRGRPLWPGSETVFRRAITGEFKIIISDWLRHELRGNLNKGIMGQLYLMLRATEQVVGVKTDDRIRKLLKEYQGENIEDYHHFLLAKKAGASCIVTRNHQDFQGWKDKIPILYPEQL